MASGSRSCGFPDFISHNVVDERVTAKLLINNWELDDDLIRLILSWLPKFQSLLLFTTKRTLIKKDAKFTNISRHGLKRILNTRLPEGYAWCSRLYGIIEPEVYDEKEGAAGNEEVPPEKPEGGMTKKTPKGPRTSKLKIPKSPRPSKPKTPKSPKVSKPRTPRTPKTPKSPKPSKKPKTAKNTKVPDTANFDPSKPPPYTKQFSNISTLSLTRTYTPSASIFQERVLLSEVWGEMFRTSVFQSNACWFDLNFIKLEQAEQHHIKWFEKTKRYVPARRFDINLPDVPLVDFYVRVGDPASYGMKIFLGKSLIQVRKPELVIGLGSDSRF